MSYRVVDELQKKAIPVQQSCRLREVSHSGYDDARRRCANRFYARFVLISKLRLPPAIKATAAAEWPARWKHNAFRSVATRRAV